MSGENVANSKEQIRILYQSLLTAWNDNNAAAFAKLFTKEGSTIGFDGSQMNGPTEIEKELTRIFSEHAVASYISVIREVRPLSSSVLLLRAVAGMIPPGETEVNSKVNVIQTLVAQQEVDQLKIAIFQNTPAAFHGRPALSAQLTQELQDAFNRLHKKEI